MKKFISFVLLFSFLGINACFANEVVTFDEMQNTTVTVHDDAPVWEDYVAPKYRNPRHDFTRKSAISELVTGIVLTDLIITSPIGIPMIVHGTTKVKMVSYNNRKNIFDEEIAKAQLIEDDGARKAAYQATLKKCNLKESTRIHYAKKAAKQKAKEEKKNQKKGK